MFNASFSVNNEKKLGVMSE